MEELVESEGGGGPFFVGLGGGEACEQGVEWRFLGIPTVGFLFAERSVR